MPKVIVGMSGGVDSSITAYLLKEQGYEVEGLSFILWEARTRTDFTTCCSVQAIEEASKTAAHIGIPHSTLDVRDDFIEKVIEPFVDAYTKGLTPNPCILCNKYIKFPFLLREAERRGAEFIATGHYAKVVRSQSPSATRRGGKSEVPPLSPPFVMGELKGGQNHKLFLKKGADPKKDQSYFLYVLRREELERLVFPLGDYKKEEVRKIAYELRLPAAQRPESQEICFIEGRNYFKFINKLSPLVEAAGPIMDMSGKVFGEHKGIYHYTIGQRKGLGISSPKPLYVVKIDALKNIVYVGSREDARMKEFEVKELNWLIDHEYNTETQRRRDAETVTNSRIQRAADSARRRVTVKVRSMMKDAPAMLYITDRETVKVVFDEPQWAPAPGQSAVFYDEDIVLGGGTITCQILP